MIKDSSSISRLRLIRKKYENVESGVTSLAINSIFWNLFPSLDLMPTHLPKISLLRSKVLSPEILELVAKNGFEAAYPKLKTILGNSAKFDIAYSTGRNLYYSFLSVYLGYIIYEYYPFLRFGVEAYFLSDNDVINNCRENFNPEKVRNEQLESWRQAFYEFEGRWPDMDNPMDKEEIDSEIERLWSVSARELLDSICGQLEKD